jgi:hypothetical protein
VVTDEWRTQLRVHSGRSSHRADPDGASHCRKCSTMNEIPLPSQIPHIVDELESGLVDLDRLAGESLHAHGRPADDAVPVVLSAEEPPD